MRLRYLLASASCGLLIASPAQFAFAQEIGSTAPSVRGDDPEYEARNAEFGGLRLAAGGEARIEYDDNVFAQPDSTTSDAILRFNPYVELSRSGGRLSARLRGALDVRRYLDETSEDAEAGILSLEPTLALGQGGTLSGIASWERSVENRGDPEARSLLGIGPRRYDVFTGGVRYNRQGARIMLNAEMNAQKIDALSALDADRDYSTWFGQAGVGFRPGGAFYLTATAFGNHRDFRLDDILTGASRDSSTYGGRLGVQFTDGGLFEGRLGAGVFQLDFDDPLAPSRTGFSLDGYVTYRPTRRSALSVNLFNGDVASFRSGATARTDTRIGVRYEQEIRHNVLGHLTAGFQKSDYFGSGTTEETWRLGAAVEYIVSRNISLVANVRYGDRASDLAFENFERFGASLGVRVRF